MNVREIVAEYLKKNGYDGLYQDECGCPTDRLMPCNGESIETCTSGYRHKLPCIDCPSLCDDDGYGGYAICTHPTKSESTQ